MNAKRTFRFAGVEYLRMQTRPPVFSYAVAVADQLGRLLLGQADVAAAPSMAGKTLVISKVDHLGDLMFITPLLVQWRAQSPSTRLVLLVGAWSAPLARLLKDLGLCDDFLVRSPWALNTGAPWHRRLAEDVRSWREARRALQALRPAALLDLRCFSPNTLLLARQARVPFRAGFPLRGLSYTLQASLRYSEDEPFGQLFLDTLPLFGLRPQAYAGPSLGPHAARLDPLALPDGVPQSPYVVVQAASRNPAKNAPLGAWHALLPRLGRDVSVVFVGGAADQATVAPLLPHVPAGRAVNLVGRTSFAQLFSTVRHAQAVVSVDSLLAHIGPAVARPTLVLKDAALTPTGCYFPGSDLRLIDKGAAESALLQAAAWLLERSRAADDGNPPG